ncbi:methylglyoxal synthase [Bacteroidia bacterium]|nr:methylglyoxal synthase [Bacteroidia bacterium]
MRLALIAHDGKKADLVSFVLQRLEFFKKEELTLFATGTTGSMIMEAGVENIHRVASGPLGGDAEIGALITRGEMDAIIFFRDPLDKHPHDVDISMLLRLCDVHNIPLATNQKSAHILVKYFNSKLS